MVGSSVEALVSFLCLVLMAALRECCCHWLVTHFLHAPLPGGTSIDGLLAFEGLS